MKVSILTANYNNKIFLIDFFDSIINNKFDDYEIVFVDDGSSDGSLVLAELYKEKIPSLNIIKLWPNVGFANALNVGLEHCKGDYIARIDPDDLMSMDRLLLQVKFLNENPCCGVVGSQARYFLSDSGDLINGTNKPIGFDNIREAFYNKDNGVLHGTVMVRASVYKRYKYVQDDVPSEDYAIFSKMIRDGIIFENINMELTFVRVHKNSVSNNLKYSTIEKLFLLRKSIFGFNYSKISLVREYLSIYFYRIAMYQKYKVLRWSFLLVAGFFGVERVFRRGKKFLKNWRSAVRH